MRGVFASAVEGVFSCGAGLFVYLRSWSDAEGAE